MKERRVPSNVLSLSEVECEEEEGEGQKEDMERSCGSDSRSSEDRSATPAAASSTLSSGGRGSRNMTPPILIDEAEMERKVCSLECWYLHR